jgi:transposase
MSNKRLTEEFKLEAVKLIKERQYSAAEVSARLGVSTDTIYAWIKKYGQSEPVRIVTADQQATIKKLQAELKRVAEERDILKKAAAYFAKELL